MIQFHLPVMHWDTSHQPRLLMIETNLNLPDNTNVGFGTAHGTNFCPVSLNPTQQSHVVTPPRPRTSQIQSLLSCANTHSHWNRFSNPFQPPITENLHNPLKFQEIPQ